MSEMFMDALPLAKQGFCCSQILVKFILDAQGVENPGLLRALHGLCKGMAGFHGACGLLTGGICAISYVTGRGGEHERAHPMNGEMRFKYFTWFKETTAECGSMDCHRIFGDINAAPEIQCNELLGKCWEKLLDLFAEYGIDPGMPPDE